VRRQLTLAGAAVTTMVVIALVVPLAVLVRTIAADRALSAAEREARTLVPVLATVTDPAAVDAVVAGADASAAGDVSVHLPDGSVLGAPSVSDADVDLARGGRAFTADAPGGRAVLVPVVVPGRETSVIRVFVPDDVLERGTVPAWLLLGGLGLGLIVVSVAVADRLGRHIALPVRDLAVVAERLGSGDLEARVEPAGPPEIADVGRTLNRLAAEVQGFLTAEREAVADLSHRLRTPVTALRLDVEGLRNADEAERLGADVDELARSVDWLIAEARRPARRSDDGTDLAGAARERVAFWAALADEQGRAYELDVPEGPCLVAVPAADLVAALDALLGNVIAHTPEGTAFRVIVERTDVGARLVVEDEGPGIDTAMLERGTSGAGSSGLGLDIARRTAESSGGALTASGRPGRGARIVMDLGSPG